MNNQSAMGNWAKGLLTVFLFITLAAMIACQRTDAQMPAVSTGTSDISDPPVTTVQPSPSSTTSPTTTTRPPESASSAPAATTPPPVSSAEPPAATTAPTVPDNKPIITDSALLESAVFAAAQQYGAVGIQVAVISDGQVSASETYGWAKLDEAPMTQDTKIRVASLTKTLIGMVTFRLVDEGKLELDADISDYIGVEVRNPSYPNDPITLRMLLAHTSSMAKTEYVNTLPKLQNTLQKASAWLNCRPGELFAYNNFAFGVIGAICEIVTGKPMNTLAKEYFFEPMGIEASLAPSELDADALAVIYNSEGEVGRSIATQQAIALPTSPVEHMAHYAGGLTISAVDYARLMTILINDGVYGGKRYLSSESVTLMESVQLIRSNGTMQCMPIRKYEGLYGQDALYFHTGSNYGVYALYTYDPESGFGCVVVTTGAEKVNDDYGIYAVCGSITRAVYASKAELSGGEGVFDEE